MNSSLCSEWLWGLKQVHNSSSLELRGTSQVHRGCPDPSSQSTCSLLLLGEALLKFRSPPQSWPARPTLFSFPQLPPFQPLAACFSCLVSGRSAPQAPPPAAFQPDSLPSNTHRLRPLLSRVWVPGIHMRSTPTRTAWRCSTKTCRVNTSFSQGSPPPRPHQFNPQLSEATPAHHSQMPTTVDWAPPAC